MLKLIRRSFACAAIASLLPFFALGVFADEYRLGALEIIHPWSRATPSGAKVAGGYLIIKNHGAAPDRLVSVAVEVAGRVGVHQMSTAGGVMTMRELKDGLEIPANGEVALKPGSYHLMFEELQGPLRQGEKFPGSLTFEKAGTVAVDFAVEPIGAAEPDHKHP